MIPYIKKEKTSKLKIKKYLFKVIIKFEHVYGNF